MASSGTRYFCLQRTHLISWVCAVTWKQRDAFKSGFRALEDAGSSSLPRVLCARLGGQACLYFTVPTCWDSLWELQIVSSSCGGSAPLHSTSPSLDPNCMPPPPACGLTGLQQGFCGLEIHGTTVSSATLSHLRLPGASGLKSRELRLQVFYAPTISLFQKSNLVPCYGSNMCSDTGVQGQPLLGSEFEASLIAVRHISKHWNQGDEEVAWQVRAQTALPEDMSSVPRVGR